MKNDSIFLLCLTSVCLMLGTAASAQSSNPIAGGTDSANQRIADPWKPVESLAPNSRLKISATRNGGDCILQSVSADGLACFHGRGTRTVQRADIRSIRIARRGRSVAGGLVIGVAAGAALGAGIGSVINSSDSGTIVHVSGGKSAGVGAGVGVIFGGAAGAIVGYSTDLFPGVVIYKRQP